MLTFLRFPVLMPWSTVNLKNTERERKGERSFHYLFVKMIQNCKSARTLLFIQERSLHSKLDLDPN